MPLRIERAPLEQLLELLPQLLSSLSLGRAQIALEQIRSTLQHRPHDEILCLVATDGATHQPLAAVIAIVQPAVAPHPHSDMATLIHADFLSPSRVLPQDPSSQPAVDDAIAPVDQQADHASLIQQLQIDLMQRLEERGVRFVQWALDPQAESSSTRWCSGFGFDQIATLDYLSGEKNAGLQNGDQNPNTLHFRPLLWDPPSEFDSFAQLVESTYDDTLDCPRLGEFRTASETLRGYQAGPAFAPTLWFRITDSVDESSLPIGCLILAKHENSPNPNNPDPEPAAEASGTEPVLEIVYMGIVPEARGRGYGKCLVDGAFAAVADAGGTKLILGVDRANTPARTIYDRMGLRPMLSETIWVRKLNPAKQGL